MLLTKRLGVNDMKDVIAIVGCGFIGSHLAEELPKLFFSQDLFQYRFRFIDFDTWEERNAANQNVDLVDAQAEKLKADTCAAKANRYFKDKAESVVEKLTAENAAKLLGDTILVIDAVDNIPTRQLMWGMACAGVSGPCLHSGISRRGEGMVNWSSPVFDTFPFKPNDVTGRDLAEQDFKEPPCEMYKYRHAGTQLFQAIAKSTAFFFGKDPWNILEGAVIKGDMTCWTTTEKRCALELHEMFLHDGLIPNINQK
jgi:hypothetical protein